MTLVDRDIARVTMPHHGEPASVAKLLREVAGSLEQEGTGAELLVRLLSDRGWAAGTLGDGGSRSSDSTSSVERAAGLADGESGGAERWAGKDRRYHALLQALERTAQSFHALHGDVVAHAGDEDHVPVGTGGCICCSTLCRPTATRPEFRLKSGMCPACYRAWRRYVEADGELVRTDWIRARRGELTDDNGLIHPEEQPA